MFNAPNLKIDSFIASLDEAMQKSRAAQPKRQYLGASMWGDTCDRKLSYMYHQYPEDEGKGFSSKILRVFDMGHDGEDRMAEYLKVAGYELLTVDRQGKQFGFSEANGLLKGHIDGVILSGPVDMPWPMLWENKALNNKSWNDTLKKGVQASKPLYYAQVNIYCAYKELPNGTLFTAQNRDTGEILAEHIPFDARIAQEASDRAVRVVRSETPLDLARCTSDPADLRCKYCAYQSTCWTKPAATTLSIPPTPPWLQRKTD
ncbi:hypothetical protein UFOVP1325_26 [uncultured Caudovirales phage]|uniref:PD-(D/E)XK nuclease superfamily n=1 Tax=uncultured Caudovirales phage TaxID=2100421 RepID=A0A6J5RN04_9CAUD|nr:hypothetical protein UFOVP1325_26 [uncultured Caudovirales phage]CAB4212346.1 hypothetical protein UFOVP1435_4 [uncultured Caudovirales phage]CAB5228009.1 hypothetical protein UFOVP1530_35 [uncultured Caudovirales phage]